MGSGRSSNPLARKYILRKSAAIRRERKVELVHRPGGGKRIAPALTGHGHEVSLRVEEARWSRERKSAARPRASPTDVDFRSESRFHVLPHPIYRASVPRYERICGRARWRLAGRDSTVSAYPHTRAWSQVRAQGANEECWRRNGGCAGARRHARCGGLAAKPGRRLKPLLECFGKSGLQCARFGHGSCSGREQQRLGT